MATAADRIFALLPPGQPRAALSMTSAARRRP